MFLKILLLAHGAPFFTIVQKQCCALGITFFSAFSAVSRGIGGWGEHEGRARHRGAGGCGPGCYSRPVQYTAPREQLPALIPMSASCSQTVRYDCFLAPLQDEGVDCYLLQINNCVNRIIGSMPLISLHRWPELRNLQLGGAAVCAVRCVGVHYISICAQQDWGATHTRLGSRSR